MKKKYNKHLAIFGTARSGISWLSELIAKQFRYRLLFEPEHQFRTKKGHLLCDLFINNFKNSIQAEKYLHQVFNNKIDCDWIAQCSNRKYKMHLLPYLPKKYIIKFVRANLAAKAINENFKIPIIHIIRNPYDVIKSQSRVKFPWLYDLSIFSNQEALVSLILDHFNFDITQLNNFSNIEKLTIRWCLENVIPLEIYQPYQYKSMIVRFEDLKNDKKKYLEICNYFNLVPISNLDEEYKKPSSKTHPKSAIINSNFSYSNFTQQEFKEMNLIFDIFETQLYTRTSN
ncbi:MAG: sulfotransferase domain-containing protein [Flavobacteriales bacterium]